MNDFVVNGDMFGRYVKIPTGHSKEMHTYKVVSRIESNGYCETPIMFPATAVLHPLVVPVLKVIHCGIDESQVIRVALADCEIVPTVEAEPTKHGRWIVNGLFAKYHHMRSCSECGEPVFDNDKFFNYCPYCGARMDGKEDDNAQTD